MKMLGHKLDLYTLESSSSSTSRFSSIGVLNEIDSSVLQIGRYLDKN